MTKAKARVLVQEGLARTKVAAKAKETERERRVTRALAGEVHRGPGRGRAQVGG